MYRDFRPDYNTCMKMETPASVGTRAAPAEVAWERIRALLKGKRNRVQEQIRQYPMPIPACDADFNAFLAERERLSEELSRLDAAIDRAAPGDAAAVREFLQSCRHLTEAEKQQIGR